MQGRRPNYAWHEISHKRRVERFMRKVTKRTDGCWEWIGKCFKNHYGSIALNLEPKRQSYHLAHRISWELFRGPIPSGLMVLHHCDRPWCVNPKCLFLGTAADNSADMAAKKRGTKVRGEASPRAKLSDQQVDELRAKHAAGNITQKALGAQFGISAKQVSVIVNFVQRRKKALRERKRVSAGSP